MAGFYGTFTPRLDDKGRLTLPARYRGAFADGAMVVRGDTRCLYIFTTDGFDAFAEEAINAPVNDPQRIGPARYMLANSDFQAPDAQGRIMLTGRMRDYADLGKDVVLTGQGKRMEVWNADRWARYESEQEPAYINPAIPTAPSDAEPAGAPAGKPDPEADL